MHCSKGELMGSFEKGDRVFQAQYGAGDVLAGDYGYTTIEFDSGLVRKFVTRLLHVQPTNEPRPVKPAAPKKRSRRRRTDVAVSDEAKGTSRP